MASRISAFTSTSCGIGVSGSTKKISASIFASAISAPICWSPPSGPLFSRRIASSGRPPPRAGRWSGGDDVAAGEEARMAARKRHHVVLLFVVRDQGEAEGLRHLPDLTEAERPGLAQRCAARNSRAAVPSGSCQRLLFGRGFGTGAVALDVEVKALTGEAPTSVVGKLAGRHRSCRHTIAAERHGGFRNRCRTPRARRGMLSAGSPSSSGRGPSARPGSCWDATAPR